MSAHTVLAVIDVSALLSSELAAIGCAISSDAAVDVLLAVLSARESDVMILHPIDEEREVRAAERRNLSSAIQICDELGLTRTKKDGSPVIGDR